MNILRIVYDWPDNNVGTAGLAPAPYGLSVAQAKLGHKIYVLCGNLNGKNLKTGKFSYSLENGSIVVFNLPRGLSHFGPFMTTSFIVLPYYFYLRLTKKIDIVHNHGHLGVWFLLYKYLFGFLDKIPVFGHLHITAKGREQALTSNGAKIDFWAKYFEYPIHRFSDYLTVRVAKKIVTVSKENINELVDLYGVDRPKIELLETGVDLNKFKRDGNSIEFGFDDKSIILGNGGRLSKRKNIDVIIRSLKLIPNEYKLVLWGEWDSVYRVEIDKMIEKEKLNNRIKFYGVVPFDDVDKYFRSIDIFLLPSSYEGLPKVVLEALAVDSKVIASGFSMSEVIPNLYFLDTVNNKSLADLIMKVNKTQSEYTRTLDIIKKHYSWDVKAQELEEIYRL